MSRRRRKRGRLKWIMLGVTVLLGVLCGPSGVWGGGFDYRFMLGYGKAQYTALILPTVVETPVLCYWSVGDLRLYRLATWRELLPGIRFVSGSVFCYVVHVSLWPPLALCLALTLLLFWRDRRRRIAPGHCSNCAYDLTGNVSGVCPECGTPVG